MDSVSLLRSQFKFAHDWLEGTMEGVGEHEAHWIPAGMANPIGALYAHIALSEDALLSGALKQEAPLAMSSWVGKAGISEPPPADNNWGEWSKRVKVDVPAIREYAHAVYGRTDEILSNLKSEDLGRELDLTQMGLGKMTVGTFVSILLANANNHCGEIACVKGLQNLKGYPM
jgi:hypothetical protein